MGLSTEQPRFGALFVQANRNIQFVNGGLMPTQANHCCTATTPNYGIVGCDQRRQIQFDHRRNELAVCHQLIGMVQIGCGGAYYNGGFRRFLHLRLMRLLATHGHPIAKGRT